MQENLLQIHARIDRALAKSGRRPGSVTLIGASKSQPAEKILELAALGMRDFGENYAQEWKAKRESIRKANPALAAELRWHFIGHLQSNKAKELAGEVALLHSVDSLRLARRLSEQALAKGKVQAVLWEVNLSGESSKSGMSAADLRRDWGDYAALPGLACRGLMTMPPPASDPEASRPYFRELKSLLDESRASGFFDESMAHLSMGMSQDFEIAVEEGSTLVRVGTSLFGPRI